MKVSTRQSLIYLGVLIVGGGIGYGISHNQSKQLVTEIKGLNEELAEQKLQSNSALLKAKIDADAAVNASKAAAEQALSDQKNQAESVLAAANAEASETTSRLQSELEQTTKQLSEQKTINANLRSQVADLEAKTAAQSEDNSALTEKLGTTEAEFAATKKKAAETENQLQTSLDETTKALSEQRIENADLKKLASDLESQVLALTVAKVNA